MGELLPHRGGILNYFEMTPQRCSEASIHPDFGTVNSNLLYKTSRRFWQLICVKAKRVSATTFRLVARRIWQEEDHMGNIFYIIGVIVVVLFILGYLGLR
jgi:hypothetical protein